MPTKTILIIDDDVNHRDLLRDVLEAAGFAVIAIGDAAEAFARLAQDIDLVLLDLVMPGAAMDGFTFLSKARQRAELTHTPVIVLSGLGDSVIDAMDPATANALHITSVVSKPVDLSVLLSNVHAVLKTQDRPSRTSRQG